MYRFADDDASPIIRDELKNGLDGWSSGLNRNQDQPSGQYASFSGRPKTLAVIPISSKIVTARYLSIGFKFKIPKKCKADRVFAAIQLDDGSVIAIQNACEMKRGDMVMELRVIPTNLEYGSIMQYQTPTYTRTRPNRHKIQLLYTSK